MRYLNRRLFPFLLLASVTYAFAAGSGSAEEDSTPLSSARQKRLVEGYGKLPLSFEANEGQTDSQVKFLSCGDGYSLFLTPSQAVLSLNGKNCSQRSKASALAGLAENPRPCAGSPDSELRMLLLSSNPDAQIAGVDELPGKSNYFVGQDSSQWHTNISNYRKVQYRDVYPGIDLVYYGNQRQLEHDFIVAPGADPKAIRLNFTGARDISIDRHGDIILGTDAGTLRFKRPVIYQQIDGVRKSVSGHYRRNRSGEIGFAIGVYDRQRELVIDPVLVYSTFVRRGYANTLPFPSLAVDPTGNSYIAVGDRGSAIVLKVNLDGSSLLYSTVIGPADPGGIAVDTQGNVYLTGATDSNNFPTVNAFQAKNNGIPNYNAFLTKLDPSGEKLIYSTYFGGSGSNAVGIAVDSLGSAYITGNAGPKLPIITPITNKTSGPYVTKFSPSGTSLEYSSYIAGTPQYSDTANAIAVDAAGEAIITGETTSKDFPAVNALYSKCLSRPYSQCDDTFVAKINAAGTALLYSTYLGAGAGKAVATNADGDAFVTGYTTAPKTFPIANALKPTTSVDEPAYLTRIDATGSALVYSTFLDDDIGAPRAIAVDKDSNVYLAGAAVSGLVTINAVQSTFGGGGGDAFIMKINSSGSALLYSTYLGGSSYEYGDSIGVDGFGNAYVLGETVSSDFPLKNPLPVPAATDNIFLAKISDSNIFQVTDTVDHTIVRPGDDLHYTITVTNVSSDPASGVLTVTSVRDRFRTCTVSNGDPCEFVVLGGRATVNIASLAVGETRTILIYATAALTAGDYNLIPNTATIYAGPPSYEKDSASAPVTVRETADIGISSTLVDNTNGVLHYVHTVTNLGPDDAHAVLLLESLPTRTSFVSAATTAGNCSFHPTIGDYGAVRCPLNNPDAGASVQIDVFLQALRADCPAVTSTTTVTSQSIDTNSANDSSTVVAQLPQTLCSQPPAYTLSAFDSTDVRNGAVALNNKGDLLGYSVANGPFLYLDGATGPVYLPLPDAVDLNDLDDVLGQSYVNDVFGTILYKHKDGSSQVLDFGKEFPLGLGLMINNLDQVIGVNESSDPNEDSGFIYQDGKTQGLGNQPLTLPSALNNKGEVAGQANGISFLYTHALMLDFNPGDIPALGVAGIDSSGRISGIILSADRATTPYIYQAGKIQDLGPGAGKTAYVTGMNDCGELVGYDLGNAGGAFIYTHGNFINLDKTLPVPAGYYLTPSAINDRGQILSGSYNPSVPGQTIEFLLTPTVLENCGSDATIDNTPDLATASLGGNITYTITVKNLDTATSAFTVTDALDPTTTLVSCTVTGGSGTCTGTPGSQSVSVALPNLAKGATATIKIKVAGSNTRPAQNVIMNTGTLSSSLTSDYLSTAYTSVP